MLPHDRENYRQQMGHVWLGFSDEQIRSLLAGSRVRRHARRALPPDANAKGPGLFVATVKRITKQKVAAATRDSSRRRGWPRK